VRKIGFIFECGRDGPDVKVCRHLVGLIDSAVEMVIRPMDNVVNLRQYCGPAAKVLLESCSKVVIVWDLYPPWRDKAPCLKEDRADIFSSLKSSGVPLSKVDLVCIHEELESWLLADERALRAFIGKQKHPHQAGRISKYKKPDSVHNPKAVLSKIFNKELGPNRKYIEYQDAKPIIEGIPDLKKLQGSVSFKRFCHKVKK